MYKNISSITLINQDYFYTLIFVYANYTQSLELPVYIYSPFRICVLGSY